MLVDTSSVHAELMEGYERLHQCDKPVYQLITYCIMERVF